MILVDMVRRLVSRDRVCPACGHRQHVRSGEERKARCEKCGAEIAPVRKSGS
jgi:NADH pyrophosphatase NudC (nudix superfamily)